MNVSKSMFVVLLMSVISLLMLSSAALAAAPKVSFSGVPSNVVAGTAFDVTVSAANDTTANQFIQVITVASDLGWQVSPQSVNCGSVLSCVAKFTVSVPSAASVNQKTKLTAQVTTSTSESGSAISGDIVVSGAPSAGNQVPVKVDAVEIDNFELSVSSNNVRDLERGQDFTLRIKLTASSDAKDIEIRAFVTGFEFSKSQDISDSTSPFDVEKGVSYVKTLKLKLPDRATEDTYRIRVIVAGRDNDEIAQNYRIKVTPTDHEVVIKDFNVNPEDMVQAGRALLATVRVKNLGDSTERDVKVRVSIPELGVTASPDFIDDLKSDESATSEEFFLRVDQCAKPGTYDVKAEVTFEEGDKTVTGTKQITVTKGACETPATSTSVSANGVRIYSPEQQDVAAGGVAVSYPITITNDGTTGKSFSLSAAASDWATVKFSPSNVVAVKGGDSQTVYLVVSANKNSPAGAQVLVVRVKDQAGDVVKEFPLPANVVSAAGAGSPNLGSTVQLLQLGLIALIVVLVVVGVVVAFRRMKGPGQGEEGTQTYY
ncbi:hypothetical protein HYY73_06195 [Candidatus Woesearchaeota archaeon]|nr:hypothetical protein [Candidatus Woesearchaeota archaeon]